MIKIVYPDESYFQSFYEALTRVAGERVYLEMTEPPPFERVAQFQRELVEKNGPVFYAVDGARVVGWCDVFPNLNPRQSHRGSLGMGLLPEYRGQGIGRQLVAAVLKKSKEFGLAKVELSVYTSNPQAIALYEKMGFEREGLVRDYRRLDGQVFDAVSMAKFI